MSWQKITFQNDHKCLEMIQHQHIHATLLRQQRILLCLPPKNCAIQYIPCKEMILANWLSIFLSHKKSQHVVLKSMCHTQKWWLEMPALSALAMSWLAAMHAMQRAVLCWILSCVCPIEVHGKSVKLLTWEKRPTEDKLQWKTQSKKKYIPNSTARKRHKVPFPTQSGIIYDFQIHCPCWSAQKSCSRTQGHQYHWIRHHTNTHDNTETHSLQHHNTMQPIKRFQRITTPSKRADHQMLQQEKGSQSTKNLS